MIDLFNDDCLNIMKTLKDGSIDFIITDPPYNIGFDSSKETHEFDEAWDHKTQTDFETFNEQWLNEAYRVCKKNSSMICFMGPTQIMSFFDTIAKTKWKINYDNWEVLYRQKGRGANHKLKSLSEDIVFLYHDDFWYQNENEYKERIIEWEKKTNNPLGWVVNVDTAERVEYNGFGDIECFTQPYYLSKSQKQIHPCQKALPMLAKLIMKYTDKNSTVLDCFMGSGSSGVAAIASGRNYIGIEKDVNMFEKAKSWISDSKSNSEITKLIKPSTFRFGGLK